MKFTDIRAILQNSMFLRLMSGFLLIILISSTFYVIAYNFFISNIEQEIVNNSNRSIDFTADKIDKKIHELKNLLLSISSEKVFSPLIIGQSSPYAQKLIVDNFGDKYLISSDDILKYVKTIFVLPEDINNNILTMESTLISKRFFEAFYKNSIYTRDFWMKEMQKEFVFNYYTSDEFLDYTNYLKDKPLKYTLMPLAFKSDINPNFIMVALIDIHALYNSVNKFDNFLIYNSENKLLYAYNEDIMINNIDIDIGVQYKKTNNGYLFSRSGEDNLKYISFLPNDKLKEQLHRTNSIFRLIAAISFILSIIISVYLVKIFNDPVKQIVDIIKRSSSKTGNNKVLSFKNIRDSIELIVEDNEAKSSMLENYFYQQSLKGTYSLLNGVTKGFIMNNYALICYNAHYKDKFRNEVSEETGQGTIILVEIIKIHVKGYFKDSVTFSTENDKIISIANVDSSIKDITPMVNGIAAKLVSEEEYVFFTITFSKTSSDISQLHEIYNKLFDITKHRTLINTTQVLSEDIIKTSSNRYYLSSEQLEQFSNLLTNSQQAECIDFVNDILLYNYKKGVTCINIQLVCMEIMNCCIKSLTKLYYDVPECFNITNLYSKFNLLTTIDEYIDLCKSFIIKVTDYIKNNTKDEDYIIDYISGYIEKHYSEEIYLDLLAEKLGITSNYISTYFKEKTGTSFNYYMNNFRIKKALELFESTSLKIKDISLKVGYPNTNTFTRIFKKQIGMTPDEYRKNVV